MSARSFSHWTDDEAEVIGPSSSKKSSSECQPLKSKKMMSKSVREMAERIKESINNEVIVKSGEDQMAVDVELTETDWTTINVKTVVNDRSIEVRSPRSKKSSSSKSSSKSSSETPNLRKTLSSTSSLEGKKREQTFSSPLELPGPGQVLLSSTILSSAMTPEAAIPKKSNFGGRNSNITKKKNIFEKNDEVSKNRKSSTRVKNLSTEDPKKMIDENSKSLTRDAEVTREAMPFMDTFIVDQPIILSRQYLGTPDLPKEHPNVVEYAEATIRGSRFDDDSIDQSDDNSGELEKSPVVPPPGQTPSPPMIKFHRADNQRANQLWDEFVSANPEDFSKNVSLHPPGTNGGRSRKRKFFKTGLSTQLESEKSENRKAPQIKHKKSRTKRAKTVESPQMVTMHGTLYFNAEDRNVFEIRSDSDDESAISSKSSAPQKLRFDDRGEGQGSNVGKKSATVEERHTKRKVNELRSVAANDRWTKRSRLQDRIRNTNDPEIMESSEVTKEAVTADDRRSKRKIAEPSRSSSVSGNDRRPERVGFAERMRRRAFQKIELIDETVDESSSSTSSVSKARGKRSREIESVYDERSAIVNLNSTNPTRIFKTVETMDLIIDKTAISDVREDLRNRDDIGEATIDESPIQDLGKGSPIPDLDLLFSRIDRVLAEISSEPKIPSNREFVMHDSLALRRAVPIMRSDVVLSAPPPKKIECGWEIGHLLTSPK